jgi:hypothetical protein
MRFTCNKSNNKKPQGDSGSWITLTSHTYKKSKNVTPICKSILWNTNEIFLKKKSHFVYFLKDLKYMGFYNMFWNFERIFY